MITLTDRAKAVLRNDLELRQIEIQVYRLTQRDDGFKLELDVPGEDDRVIRHQESPVLVIDGDMDEELDDLLVDVAEGEGGKPRLTLRRMTWRPLA